jgi:metallo-beta-lactamase class B
MNFLFLLLAAGLQAQPGQAVAAPPASDAPFLCDNCDTWNKPQTPFKLHGRSYYVGTHGLSSVLIQTSAGLIVLDGGLPQSAPLIEANIRSLGFKVEDIKFILNSHAHYDHAGGIARLQRDSGATVVASASGAQGLMGGMPVKDDPQYGVDGKDGAFPKVPKVQVVKDNEVLRLGDVAITAHYTPGHTPGSTTWTWSSCQGPACVNMVYADSLNAVSSPGFRFLGDRSHPDVSQAMRRSIARVAALPCTIMVSVHPDGSGLFDKLAKREASPTPDPLVDNGACKAYAAGASHRLDERLKTERARARK